jgi:hypothetical protein
MPSSSPSIPDLRLKSSSGAINKGTHLTTARSSGSNSKILDVEDAMYFQDGTWGSILSDIKPDWIAIGSVNNVVQIKSIDYKSNRITLASPSNWKDKDKVWLYRKSDGAIVLNGDFPDIGANEFGIAQAPSNIDYGPKYGSNSGGIDAATATVDQDTSSSGNLLIPGTPPYTTIDN